MIAFEFQLISLIPKILTNKGKSLNKIFPKINNWSYYTYFIFVADAADIVRGEFFVMWKNFRYREILVVEKFDR